MIGAREPDALSSLRRARRKNRMADLDWFEAAYKVYVVALVFGGAALWASGFVKDEPLSVAGVADVQRHGPAALGLLAAVCFVAGLRSGSRGGPLAVEEADVRHVLLAPVDRRRALLRPAIQRLRSAAFAGAGIGALGGELAGRRLPGSVAAWAVSGAAFGANAALLFIAAALVAHALHVPRWMSTTLGVIGISWQVVAIVARIPGPANLDGSLALWGMRQRAIDLVAVAFTLGLAFVGVALLRRTSLDALARRSGLVAQLRFAVTMQDLRTVMLLRRQLSQENTRMTPWIRLKRGGRSPVEWRRGWHSLLRFPIGRLLRMTVLAVGIAFADMGVYRGTAPLFLVAGGLSFLLGMEVMEPVSQEVDQPDSTSSFAVERGGLLARLAIAPAVALLPFAVICVGAVALVDRGSTSLTVAAILAVPTLLGGAAGSLVSIVKDAPDATNAATEQAMLPPELSGMTTVVRMLIPIVVSTLAHVGVVVLRNAHTRGQSEIGTALRIVVAQLLVCAAVAWWVRRRDAWKIKINAFLADGRQASIQQRNARQA